MEYFLLLFLLLLLLLSGQDTLASPHPLQRYEEMNTVKNRISGAASTSSLQLSKTFNFCIKPF